MVFLIGIDIGTTNIKGIVFNREGKKITSVSRPISTHYRGTEIADFCPEEIWEDVREILRKLISQCPHPEKISALSFASFGEAGVAVDERGEPLAPSIVWFDQRSKNIIEEWQKRVDDYEVFQITGMQISHIPSLAKILWERENLPEVYRRAAKWLFMASYIILKLTGEYRTDYSTASRSMLFDIHRKVWSERMCELAGIRMDLLPPAVPSGTAVGEIRNRVASDLGLKSKVTVVMGGHDHPCGAFSVGLRKTGEVVNSTGTVDALYALIDPGRIDRRFFEAGVCCGCHVVEEQTYMIGGTLAAGRLIDWFIENFYADSTIPKERIYDVLIERAASSPVGSNGVAVLPHLRGSLFPCNDPLSKGAILGLRTTHTLNDIIHAIFEGLSLELRIVMDNYRELTGDQYPEVKCIGGGSRNRLWIQIKADVLERKMIINDIRENTSLGAAILAGIGAGIYRNPEEVFRTLKSEEETFLPNPDNSQIYRQIYGRFYRGLYQKMIGVNRDIEEVLKILP